MDSRDLVTPAEELADDARRAARSMEREEARAVRRVRNTSRKGKRGERVAAALLERWGGLARRQPGSGRYDGLPHDAVGVFAGGERVTAEAKQFRNSKWKTLEKMRAGADLLVLCQDQQAVGVRAPEPMIFCPASTISRLVEAAYDDGRRSGSP